MTLENFQKLISTALSYQDNVCHILNSDTSLLVSCNDGSSFYINILESKPAFIHDNQEEKYAMDYYSSHSVEDFRNAVLDLRTYHPGFFLYFLIFTKLEELGIIDSGLFFHLNDSIVHYEKELDVFTIELLKSIRIDKD